MWCYENLEDFFDECCEDPCDNVVCHTIGTAWTFVFRSEPQKEPPIPFPNESLDRCDSINEFDRHVTDEHYYREPKRFSTSLKPSSRSSAYPS